MGPGASGADGQVHKVIRVISTSEDSWEAAARAGVAEASKTIADLQIARVTELDTVVDDGGVVRFRVKLEMAFQLDRTRRTADGKTVEVRRYLIVANQTLVSPALREMVAARAAEGLAEFHILVPRTKRGLNPGVFGDPMTGFIDETTVRSHDEMLEQDRHDAVDRLRTFVDAIAGDGFGVTGEVGGSDPLAAVRTVMERASFDEVIISTLPLGASRWLKMDVVSRLQRSLPLPVTALIQDEPGDDVAACAR